MNAFQQYLVPWSISQLISIVILVLAIKKPVWTRYIFAVIFISAGVFNLITSSNTPQAYLMYADTAVGFYREFINGWFKEHVTLTVSVIAFGQLLIGAGMIAGRRWMVLGCLGIIAFLLAIAPLGIGSAFPFSLTVSVAAYFVYRHYQTRWGSGKFNENHPGISEY